MKSVFRFVLRNAGAVTLVSALLMVVGTVYSIKLYKNLRTEIEELLPTDARSGKDLQELNRRIDSIDALSIMVISKDSTKSKKFVDDFAAKVKALPPGLVAYVEYNIKAEVDFFKKRLPLFLSKEDLVKIRDYMRDRIRYEKEFNSPLNIFPVSERFKKPELDLAALQKKYTGNSSSSLTKFEDGYYISPDLKTRFAFVYMKGRHSDVHQSRRLFNAVRKIVSEMNPVSYAPDMQVKFAGEVAEILEEQDALVADLELSTILVLVLCSLAMLIHYRDMRGTWLLMSSLFFGCAWTFGASYFLVGYLNANSAFLGSIVIGNGINFGLIMVARYLEELRKGHRTLRAVWTAMKDTAPSTVAAALAAGFSYGALIVTRFRGFRQFGVIGLVGMVLCWISAFTLLPAIVLLWERKFPRKRKISSAPHATVSAGIAWTVGRWPKAICAIAIVVTVSSIAFFPKVGLRMIETNLERLRNKDTMTTGAGANTKYVVSTLDKFLSPMVILAENPQEAERVAEKLRERKLAEGDRSLIGKVVSLGNFLPTAQREKIPVINEIRKMLTPTVVDAMEAEQRAWAKKYFIGKTLLPFTQADMPEMIVRKFREVNGEMGRIVAIELPTGRLDEAVEAPVLIGFIDSLRALADSVRPGIPVAGQLPITADMIESIMKEGPMATALAFAAVIVLVIVLFRKLNTIALALFSLLLGITWLVGYILAADLKINFLNFIALPITFGIGIDYGVNILQRYRIEGRGKILTAVRQTGGAVLLASLTTVLGYGSLIIASNQAFVTFGTLAIIGEFTCTLAALVVLPAYLKYRDSKREKNVRKMFNSPNQGDHSEAPAFTAPRQIAAKHDMH